MRSKENGFTLMEVVIALAIFGVMMSLVYSTIIQTARTAKSLESVIDLQHAARALITGLSSELRTMTDTTPLLAAPGTTNRRAVHFRGEDRGLQNTQADSFTFIASEGGIYLPGRTSTSSLVQITYRLAPDPESNSFLLVRSEVPVIYPVQDAYEKTITFPVSKSVNFFNARYFNSTLKQWQDTWDEQSAVPRTGVPAAKVPLLVELTIGFVLPSGKERTYSIVVSTLSQ